MIQEIKTRQHQGWIGVDLDGTLAHYQHGMYPEIGEPVAPMLALVKGWIARGEDVRIFTARVCEANDYADQLRRIQDWCQLHIGRVLNVTNKKDFNMSILYDDRAVRIIFNTGITCCDLKGDRA